MILDSSFHGPASAPLRSDIVIIGAGTLGLYLAKRLSSLRREILLVESGDRVASTEYNSKTSRSVGKWHEGTRLGRAAGLGGTSVLWGGQLAEFNESDLCRSFDWGFTFSELQRLYPLVYKQLNLHQPLTNEEYEKRLGGETRLDQPVERFFTHWLPEPNFARLFRKEVILSDSIKIILNATVCDIQFENEVARSVEAITTDGQRFQIRAKIFIFASGTIPTCRFFLTTGVKSHVPWRSHKDLGHYFQDHLGGKVADVTLTDESKFRAFFENGWVEKKKIQPKIRFARLQERRVPSAVAGMFAFNSSLSENVSNLKYLVHGFRSGLSFSKLRTCLKDLGALNRAFIPLVIRYIRHRRVRAFFDRGVEFNVQAEQIPVYASRVFTSGSETAKDGLLPVAVDWRVDGQEIESIRDFCIHVDAYLKGHGIGALQINPSVLQKDKAVLDQLHDTYHMCGGMRISSDKSEGLVDSFGKVWGTDNVFVCGAVVFPTSGHANCTLTALALAERLAERIQGHHRE